MLESTTDNGLRETVDVESVNNDSEKESEYILGEPAVPISSMHANNDVPQPKTLRGSRDISWLPGLDCLFNFPKSHGQHFVPEWYEKYPWLEDSACQNKVYCFTCRHFSTKSTDGNSSATPKPTFLLRHSIHPTDVKSSVLDAKVVRNVATTMTIPLRITERKSQPFSKIRNYIRKHNSSNCIIVSKMNPLRKAGSSNLFVPSIMLSKVMSLAPKIDELRDSTTLKNVDLICITETWLQSHIHDNILSVPGYSIERHDRSNGQHGGVCIYIRNSIKYQVLHDMMNTEIEALWVKLRPSCLPRGISCIILCNLYHPPSGNDQQAINYLYESLTTIEANFPSCGIILLGDFNKLITSRITNGL